LNGSVTFSFVIPTVAEGSAVPRTSLGNVFRPEHRVPLFLFQFSRRHFSPCHGKICAKIEEKSAEADTSAQVMAMANYLFDPDKVATSFPFKFCPTSMATAPRV
jgi:hypothetical protein